MNSTATEVLYAAALRGEPVTVVDHRERHLPLPVARWSTADASDHRLIEDCVGATLDVGCGPGRMTQGLADRGATAVGIDVCREAVRQTRARGATAFRRDVFGAVPWEGRWDTVLLADGNIGIGGDPVRLLRRVHDLLGWGGRVVVDLAPPGGQSRVMEYRLAGAGLVSDPFPWAVVSTDAITDLAESSGFVVHRTYVWHGRWYAVLVKGVPDAA
jgi:SAM-dependent methyltransferase